MGSVWHLSGYSLSSAPDPGGIITPGFVALHPFMGSLSGEHSQPPFSVLCV